MLGIYDCIAAISTPPGKGGVAVIRISGEGTLEIADKIFLPVLGKKLSEYHPRLAVYGRIIDGGEVIDDGVAVKYSAPHSYTGEDTVEISCHGGILITRTVLEAIFKAGARPAEAGEFTKRALINGRVSLTEAEAIGNLVEARSRAEIKLTACPARRRLIEKIDNIRKALSELMSSVYARIDYPDEDLGDFDEPELSEALYKIKDKMSHLLSTYRTGRAITEGIPTAIVGKPNVGKSTLYNLLSGSDAAIVTDIPGTTRDVLTSTLPLGNVLLRISDTAGIRSGESLDTVERIGIERSRKAMEECELLFAIFDVSAPFDAEDAELLEAIKNVGGAKIAILNKTDRASKFDKSKLEGIFEEVIEISAERAEDEAIGALTKTVERLFLDERITVGEDAVISSARQHAALARALEFVTLAADALKSGVAQDAVSSDLERALGAIAELDGREVSEEIVNGIFSKFCVGK